MAAYATFFSLTYRPQHFIQDEQVNNYVSIINERCVENNWSSNFFRDPNIRFAETLFSSSERRTVVERAFLKVGAKLVMAAQNPALSMRPLGFEKLETLGFGSLFVTYRNIANNCPLALWYGDPSYGPSHPFGLWYPLFPRKTNRLLW